MAASAQPLEEVTECPICTEVYTDPRVLPCIHTYCLQCIEGCGIDKKPGEKLPCPLCRKEFVIPDNGLAELPKNFFVNKLLHVREISTVELSTQALVCDVCSHDKSSMTQPPTATVYCIECQEKLCKLCSKVHKNQRLSKCHNTIAVGDKLALEDIFTSFPAPPCEKHSTDLLRFYCFDCRLVICMACLIEGHSSHKCSDVHSLKGDFQTQITKDVRSIAAGLDKCKSLLESLLKEKNGFVSQAAQIEFDINSRTDELKITLEHNRKKLVSDLESAKQGRISDVESVEAELKQHITMMEGFTTYAAQVQQKGSAFELASEAGGLHNKADELLVLESIGQAVAHLGHADLSFKPTTLAADDGNLIGEVVLLRDYHGAQVMPSTPTLTQVISVGLSIYGITALGHNIFTIWHNRAGVHVYDSTTFKLLHTIAVQASHHRGLICCARYNCLYVASSDFCYIYRVDLGDGNATMKWKTDKTPFALSINSVYNVLVACNGTNKLQEFTTFGILVREVILQDGVSSPFHAVQIANGQYIVSHGNPTSVSVIGVDGKVVDTYDNSQTFGAGPLGQSMNVAVCKNGCILVADTNNKRILAMNPTLSCAHEIPFSLSIQDGLQGPWALWFDESQGRLYVGEYNGGRILIFDNVKNIGINMKL